MKIDKLSENIRPFNHESVRYKETGNIIEVLYQPTKNLICPISKISKDLYVIKETGEVKEFVHIENRSENLKSVAKSLAYGRDLINTNVLDVRSCLWITLTYRENMTDTKKLYYDFDNFNRRLKAVINKHYDYIICAEPQGRGSWHLHCLFIFSNNAPFISNDVIWKAWSPKGYRDKLNGRSGYDFVKTKKLDDVDNVGAYLTAYLGDLELSLFEKNIDYFVSDIGKKFEIKDVVTKDGLSKRIVKGARLRLYPPQFHIFRWSKGIKKPYVQIMSEKEAKKKVSSAKLTYEKSIMLSEPGSDFESVLNYRYYNLQR